MSRETEEPQMYAIAPKTILIVGIAMLGTGLFGWSLAEPLSDPLNTSGQAFGKALVYALLIALPAWFVIRLTILKHGTTGQKLGAYCLFAVAALVGLLA